MRVLYLGMLGEFSRLPLAALLAAGVNVCGVIVPGEGTAVSTPFTTIPPKPLVTNLPLLTPYSALNIIHLAWEQDIPVYEMRQPNHSETLAALAKLQPDVAFVACFSRRIPAKILAIPQHGFLNLHPSLLPAYRGPEPLFWQFREGERKTGVTLHFMDDGLDTGDIALQSPVTLPNGISGAEADRLCSQVGTELMLAALNQLAANRLPRKPQTTGESYQPSPKSGDFQLDTTWSAQRAFNFMRGTADFGRPYPVNIAGERVRLTEALGYEPDRALDHPIIRNGREMWIQFTPGVLHVTA